MSQQLSIGAIGRLLQGEMEIHEKKQRAFSYRIPFEHLRWLSMILCFSNLHLAGPKMFTGVLLM